MSACRHAQAGAKFLNKILWKFIMEVQLP